METTASKSETSTAFDSDILKVVLPFALAVLVQIPLLVLYYIWLQERPHYSSWYPFAIIATGSLIWMRWPKDGKQVFMDSLWSNILLVVGLAGGLGAVVFVEPWLAAFSVFTLLTSLMARIIDRQTGRGNWRVTLPLFVSLAIPLNLDRTLITALQSVSAYLTSRLLDLVNVAHYNLGTVIKTPDGEYGVEEACSGIQSFFLLIFVAVVLSVWLRRTFFRSAILVGSAVLWSIFMNTIRIFAIPFSGEVLDIDLAHGVLHDLLGWSTMGLGVLLLLSTDQFLMFLFGPVDVSTGSSGPMGKFITRIWNNLIAGEKNEEDSRKKRRPSRQPLSLASKGLAWSIASLLTVGGIYSLWDIHSSYEAPKKTSVNFFTTEVLFPLEPNSLPETIDQWVRLPQPHGYKSSNRNRISDLGQKSDEWNYRFETKDGPYLATTSFDQAFPGWHELTRCYTNQGWELVGRKIIQHEPEDGGKKWNYVEANFTRQTGESSVLYFSLFDSFGEAVDPPEINIFQQISSRITNRLSQRIRASLFQSAAYQTQVFVQRFGPISPEAKSEIRNNYLKIREIMRQELIAKKEASQNKAVAKLDQ